MKKILKIIAVSFFATVCLTTTVPAQIKMQGPPMLCGASQKMLIFAKKFNETELLVLQEDRQNKKPYFVLYRNEKSGTWTFIAYNVPNAPPDIICVLHGGMSSYILPDVKAYKKMWDEQQDGLDDPAEPNVEKAT